MSLERIVRPFQSTTAFEQSRKQPAIPRVDVAVLVWGSAGGFSSILTFNVAQFTLQPGQTHVETRRTTENERVENPNDSSQFVIVEKVKQISFRNLTEPFENTYKLNN